MGLFLASLYYYRLLLMVSQVELVAKFWGLIASFSAERLNEVIGLNELDFNHLHFSFKLLDLPCLWVVIPNWLILNFRSLCCID